MKLHTLLVLLGLLVVGCERFNNPVLPSFVDAVDTAARASGASLSMQARKWQTVSTPNPYPLRNDATGALAVDVLAAPNSLGYLTTVSPSRTLTGTLRASLRVSGTGTIAPSQPCGGAATVRPMIHSYRDDWSRVDARWWSSPVSMPLVTGEAVLVVPIAAGHWSNVSGGWDAAQFTAAMSQVSSLGVTFGDSCFGHGIYAAGPLTVTLRSYEVL